MALASLNAKDPETSGRAAMELTMIMRVCPHHINRTNKNKLTVRRIFRHALPQLDRFHEPTSRVR